MAARNSFPRDIRRSLSVAGVISDVTESGRVREQVAGWFLGMGCVQQAMSSYCVLNDEPTHYHVPLCHFSLVHLASPHVSLSINVQDFHTSITSMALCVCVCVRTYAREKERDLDEETDP